MNKVYLVVVDWMDGSSNVLAVYSDEAAAIADACERNKKNESTAYDPAYRVEPWELRPTYALEGGA